MDTDIYVLKAFYCGFCSLRNQPLDQNDVPDYLARRVQLKPRVECTIHGDICGFVVTTAKTRAFPGTVINGYIALNNVAHTVAVRHCETDHFLAGYRFFSFESTQHQDYFIQYLDVLLDSHISIFKKNSATHYDCQIGRRSGPSGPQSQPCLGGRGGIMQNQPQYRQRVLDHPPPVPAKPRLAPRNQQNRVSHSSSNSYRSIRVEGGLNIHKRRHRVR